MHFQSIWGLELEWGSQLLRLPKHQILIENALNENSQAYASQKTDIMRTNIVKQQQTSRATSVCELKDLGMIEKVVMELASHARLLTEV